MKTPDRLTSIVLSACGIGAAVLCLAPTSSAQYCISPQTYCTAKTTSLGQVPQIGSLGAPEISSNSFCITLTGATANRSALVVASASPASSPFFAGTLCLASPLSRSPVLTTSASGSLLYHVPLNASMNGVRQHYQVWFRDGAHPDGTGVGLSNALTTVFALDSVFQIPPAPSSLSASPVGTDAVQLNWTDNANNETVYRVARLDPGEDPNNPQHWDNVGDLTPNATSFPAGGLTQGSTYRFKVRCGNDCGYSNYSNEVIVTTNCPYLPPPANLSASSACIGQIRLDWTDNSSSEIEFRVARLDPGENEHDPNAWDHIGSSQPNVPTFTDTSAQTGAVYGYKVRANDGCGFSAYSNTGYAASLCVPVAPWNCVATRQGNTPAADPILVTWNHTGQCASEIRISRLPPGGNANNSADWVHAGVAPGNALSFTDYGQGLINGQTYYYRVRAALYTPCGPNYYSAYSNSDPANP